MNGFITALTVGATYLALDHVLNDSSVSEPSPSLPQSSSSSDSNLLSSQSQSQEQSQEQNLTFYVSGDLYVVTPPKA
jgi:hypothetical protein